MGLNDFNLKILFYWDKEVATKNMSLLDRDQEFVF